MFEIYTPEAWHAFFQTPQLVIDDNGLIYNKNDYDKFIRGDPIGMINLDTGYIYGGDFHSIIKSAIGKYVKKTYYDCIYGPDYDKLLAEPILYIEDNKIYSPYEFTSLKFRPKNPSAYIKDTTKHKKLEQNKARKSDYEEDKQAEYKNKFSWKAIVVICLAILFCIAFYSEAISDIASGSREGITVLLICLGSCLLVSFFTNQWINIAIIGTIIAVIAYIFYGDNTFLEIILSSVLTCLFTFPLGGLVWFIRKTVDKVSKKNESSLASNPFLIGGLLALIAIVVAIIYVNPTYGYETVYDNNEQIESTIPPLETTPSERVDSSENNMANSTSFLTDQEIEQIVNVANEKVNTIQINENSSEITCYEDGGDKYYVRNGALVAYYDDYNPLFGGIYHYYYDAGKLIYAYYDNGSYDSVYYYNNGELIRCCRNVKFPDSMIISNAPILGEEQNTGMQIYRSGTELYSQYS